jgi:hypothetical protein
MTQQQRPIDSYEDQAAQGQAGYAAQGAAAQGALMINGQAVAVPRQGFLTMAFVWMFVGVLLSAVATYLTMTNETLFTFAAQWYLALLIAEFGGDGYFATTTWDPPLIVPLGWAQLIGVMCIVLCWIFNVRGMRPAVGLSYVVGYMFYDLTHYYLHHYTPRSEYGKRLKKNHMLHHFKDHSRRFCVSNLVWDRLFGTGPS